jgi:flagellar biosynthesis/type III secretory pathway M-ring protein FliF/YscJ
MGLALSKQQMILLLVLALLTVLVISAVIFSTVTHFDTLHWGTSWLSPDFTYGGF